NSFSRRSAVSFLESANPAMGFKSSKITAAATTGPANGPRPASSTPATKPGACHCRQTCSGSAREDFLDGMGRQSRCVFAQNFVQSGKSLFYCAYFFTCVFCIVQPLHDCISQSLWRGLILQQLW